jgi:BNR repeat-like domain
MQTGRDRNPRWRIVGVLAIALTGARCGGGSSPGPAPPPIEPPLAAVRLSANSPFALGCDGVAPTGTLYLDGEVEPSAVVSASNPANLVAAWQQDRWSDDGAHGIVTAASFDTGHTWTLATPQFSRCAGGSTANGTDYERASDPWVTIAADGTIYALALSFTGATLAPNSSSAMLVARSTDGGTTWGTPVAVVTDGSTFFNDKGSITADPLDAHYVYVVWDRVSVSNNGPTYLARSTDGGVTWEAARSIYDPGASNQTIGNILVCLPGGAVLVLFTELDTMPTKTTGALKVIRSVDRGLTWSAPTLIAPETPVGTHDPLTGAPVRDGSDLPSIAVDHSGGIYVVWQDSRFSGGQRDGIALAHSSDGGATWSQPLRVNGDAATEAFLPTVSVRADGVIGVSYYDFRNNMLTAGQLTTDVWLATSTDALTWHDTHVRGPFSLLGAPNAHGLFLGDYQALVASGSEFLPVIGTATGEPANPTDVFVAFASAVAAGFSPGAAVADRATDRAAIRSAAPVRARARDTVGLRTAH